MGTRPHHWESIRETITGVIDALPDGPLKSALRRADDARHPRTVLLRWACALGRKHFGEDHELVPAYADAVLSGESTFVYERDAGADRDQLTSDEIERLDGMRAKWRVMHGGEE